jgi:hypothetical protein
MKHRSLAASLTLFAVAAACSQLPTKPSDSDSSGARYVDAAALTSSNQYADVDVLTSVALEHVAAADAEVRLQAKLPEGVRVSRAGGAQALLIQGRGRAVQDSIKELERIDAR